MLSSALQSWLIKHAIFPLTEIPTPARVQFTQKHRYKRNKVTQALLCSKSVWKLFNLKSYLKHWIFVIGQQVLTPRVQTWNIISINLRNYRLPSGEISLPPGGRKCFWPNMETFFFYGIERCCPLPHDNNISVLHNVTINASVYFVKWQKES